jgi:hypothetical protein
MAGLRLPFGTSAVFVCIERRRTMNPQTQVTEMDAPEEIRLEEPFVRQVEDHSLPAQQVLTDQQDGREPDQSPALFVP